MSVVLKTKLRHCQPRLTTVSPRIPPIRGILKGDTCVVADGGADKSPTWLR